MNYHFIAIGGSAMHNLAIALLKKGDVITGSDDEIFEPSRTRLANYGLLPKQIGWFPDKIHSGIDAIVLGMHAKADNPELLKAEALKIPVFSYPEFLYKQAQNKIRVVIGGSHGKTTTTAMIMHVLKSTNRKFDYMVGAQLEGFETMVDFNDDAEIAVFEGDEYLTSPIDSRPKFHLYKPHIALITGIAWDHINVFPTFDIYVEQFRKFIDLIEDKGSLVYFKNDEQLQRLVNQSKKNILRIPYQTHEHRINESKTWLKTKDGDWPISIFGEHNLQNISGALAVCKQLGITENDFYRAIGSFNGAAKRLQLLSKSNTLTVFQDFAHSPSKLKATIDAVRNQFPKQKIIACMELHTFSSLKKEFLIQYRGTMQAADTAMVYFSHHALALKKLEPLTDEVIYESFGFKGLKVFSDSVELKKELFFMDFSDSVLLLLSSGNFDGINIKELAEALSNKWQ
ncbi:MAG: peptidoglycan synthetase [Bacteroidetes bacterium HGW-Bacteroidetes-4]|jgi:UDP-N-acetylmuramate: L-alanyl-gamma-D-glutamyl-meso-diaminopimelate ligase|nr:MAG: peptidoglycan synthetase [Bacteroidetes bacterium HGW-Bacteroidetes-4]